MDISSNISASFASALSIGIGFGLQSIVSNFVSGLILLVEQPVKVGDWIAIGDLEGDVRKVNVRATEIEMKDHSRLIVPNLDLITKTVRNVTHAGALGRARIVIRVNDDAPPIALRTLILGLLTAHAEVLKDPAPAVYLTDAKDGGSRIHQLRLCRYGARRIPCPERPVIYDRTGAAGEQLCAGAPSSGL